MIKKVLIPLFLLGIIIGCKKASSSIGKGVPDTYVYFTANVNYGQYDSLQHIGGWAYVANAGYDGIILFRSSSTTILAFDRGCPYDCASNIKAIDTFQTTGITARCPVCGTTYTLYGGGTVASGPGTLALRQYYTSYYHPILTVSSNPL